jgi:hypothetical protein
MKYEELSLEELMKQTHKMAIISGLVSNLLEIEAAAVPEIFRSYSFPVTEKTMCIDQSVVPTLPWISCRVANDGKADVYVFINEIKTLKEQDIANDTLHTLAPVKYAPLRVGETMEYDIGFSGIFRVYIKCNTGDESMIRIFSAGRRPVSIKEVGS